MSWLPLWATTTLIVLLSFAHPVSTLTDEDEFYWIGSAYYFDLAFAELDWRHDDWRLLPARENPPVAKYVLGFGIRTAGGAVKTPDILGTFYLMFERMPGAWGEGEARAKRAAVVARMNPALREQVRGAARLQLSPEILLGARGAVIGCAVVASFLMLVLGARLASGLAGFVASQALLLHPGIVEAYNHAHADMVAVTFTLGGILAADALGDQFASSRRSAWRRWLLAAVTGVLLGLACGAKMNSLPAFVAAAAVAAGRVDYGWWRDRRLRVTMLGALATVAGAALLTFVAVNPTLLQDLSGGLRAVVEEHRLTEQIQASFLAGHLTAFSAKVAVVAALVGRHALVAIALAGFATFLLVRGTPSLRALAFWFFVSALLVTAWIPFARERYVLPVVIPAALIVGVAASDMVRRLRRPRGVASPAPVAETVAH